MWNSVSRLHPWYASCFSIVKGQCLWDLGGGLLKVAASLPKADPEAAWE